MRRIVALTLALSAVLLVAWSSPEEAAHWNINQERVDRGLSRLEVTDFLRSYAERRAHAITIVYGHDPCEGCAEIIGSVDRSEGAAEMVREWMGSPDHRDIILTPGLQKMGCGKFTGEWQDSGFVRDWWVCEFRY